MSNFCKLLIKIGQINKNVIRNVERLHRKVFSEKYLLSTNIAISFTLSSLGDIIEQNYEKQKGEIEKYVLRRTVKMSISGAAVGCFTHHWYQILDKRMPGNTINIVMKKILLDQMVCSPVYITVVFVTVGLLEKKTITEIVEEAKQKAWRLYAADWAVWPVAQFINFYWLSPKHRMIYDSTISLGYDIYTSRVKNSH